MEGGVDVVLQDQEEGLLVVFSGEVLLRSSQVEAHDPLMFELDRQVCQPQGHFRGDVADTADDDPCANTQVVFGPVQPALHRFDGFGARHAFTSMQNGGVAHFHIANPIIPGVLGQLIGRPFQGFRRLKHLQRNLKVVYVVFQRADAVPNRYDSL